MTKRTLKKSLKFFVVILSLLAFLFILLIIWLTATEFRPAPVESAQLYSAGSDVLSVTRFELSHGTQDMPPSGKRPILFLTEE